MKAIHYFNKNQKIQKQVDEKVGFYLSNRLGGYLWLNHEPISRYQGWFFTPPESAGCHLFRVVENIELPNCQNQEIKKTKNNFYSIKREREKIKEEFFLSPYFNVLSYNLSKPESIDLVLDIKDIYDNSEKGRIYEIFKEKDLLIIKCQHKNSDLLVYLAIHYTDRTNKKYKKLDEWIKRDYYFDRKRNSYPVQRWVYRGLRVKTNKLIIAVSLSKRQAKEEARYVSKNIKRSQENRKENLQKIEASISNVFWSKQKELSAGYYCAAYNLNNLVINNRQRVGLYAGLPWFFQFWARDEAISLKSLMALKPQEAKKIFWRLLDLTGIEGDIENSSDAVGWAFKRAEYFIYSKKFSSSEVKLIQQRLERIIDLLLNQKTEENFAISEPYSTWMDSLLRDGARIEIQALRISMYKLARELTKNIKKENWFFQLEQKLKNRVKEEFWDGEILADGIYPKTLEADFTIRPNIFLAAYIYPKLLSKKEWIRCFDKIISQLWLDWGGFSTIDKDDNRYQPISTGENSTSYHQGDSWFFVNNLAAIVLFRLDKKRYKSYIESILRASVDDLLWCNTLAGADENSSANNFDPFGCFNQAWSSATYMEMMFEMRKELIR